jgi:hypothetical protein
MSAAHTIATVRRFVLPLTSDLLGLYRFAVRALSHLPFE